MTSSGGHVVWPFYGAVSAAKAALESHIRQLALELAPQKITANAILAGVTDTPALRQIPGHDHMLEMARARNPMGRLTEPEDVAGAIACFSQPELLLAQRQHPAGRRRRGRGRSNGSDG